MSLQINPKDSTILEFEVQVEGSQSTPQPRLVVPINDAGISLAFEGDLKDNKVFVDISELLKLTDSTEFSGKLEVVVEDNIFVPWEETIEIIKPLEVKASAKKTSVTESKKVRVSASKSKNKNVEEVKPMKLKSKSAKDLFFGD